MNKLLYTYEFSNFTIVYKKENIAIFFRDRKVLKSLFWKFTQNNLNKAVTTELIWMKLYILP